MKHRITSLPHVIGATLFLLWLWPAVSAWATDYFVAIDGNDASPGTKQQPFWTLQKAADVVAPGDTIVVSGGVYAERVVLRRSGERDRPITLRGAFGQKVVIDGEGVDVPMQYGLLELDRVAHVVVENLEIRNSTQDGIRAPRPAHLTIRRMNVHHCGRSGMMLTHQPERSDSHVLDCDVHDNQLAGIAIWENSGGYFTLRGNRVWGNLGISNWDGIEIIDTPYVAVLDNTVYDNAPHQGRTQGDQIDAGGTNSLTSPSHHVIYDGNLVYGRGGGVKMNNEPLHCIIRRNVILDTGLDFYEGPTKIAVYHNTVVNGPHALQFWGNARSMNFGGTQVRNNLLVDSTSYAVNIGNKAVPSTDSICRDYNLYRFLEGNFRGINVNAATFDATFPPTDAGLAQFRERTGQEFCGKAVTQARSEMFADPDSRDFRLKPDSVAVDAGGPLTVVISQPEPNTIRVGNAWFFQDGWKGLLKPDAIRVGDEIVPVEAVDYDRHEIRVGRELHTEAGTSVSLPYRGEAPDAGAFEFQRARLLFRSGFEPDVTVAAPFAHNGHWWQELAGKDRQSGYAWPADVPAAARVWFYYSVLEDKPLADFVETRIEQIPGPLGMTTHALCMTAKRDDVDTSSNTRNSLGLRMGRNDELEEAYCRYWIKLQPNLKDSLHNEPSNSHWRMLMEWFESGSDYRVGLYILQPRDGGRLFWQLQGQQRSPVVKTEWQEVNKHESVPAGEWFLLEVYFKRSTGSDGCYRVTVNGKPILDHRGKNMQDSSLGTWCLFKAYTPKAAFDRGPVYQWIDDVEIWSAAPGDDDRD